MAEKDIIQNMISRLGQSQNERFAKELGVHFADVEERSPENLLVFAKNLADQINFYRDNIAEAAGDWGSFFPFDGESVKALRERTDGATPPHLALFLAFLELYQKPREILNRLTGRHLDFYYREVLRLTGKPALPDRAHVLVELKKNAPPVRIGPGHLFSAGKDAAGVELLYRPVRETVINTARIVSLRSLYVDPAGTVRQAPIANSSDGLGGELPSESPHWRAFGYPGLPPAEVGFALASPVLRMKEGRRKVKVKLVLGNADPSRLTAAALAGAFEVFVTGEKGWLGPCGISPTLASGGVLQFDFTLPESEKGVVDYDPEVHGYAYVASAPVLQVLLKPGNPAFGYSDLRGIVVRKASISVEVANVTSLRIESDAGALDPKKSFLPFGPQPTRGARFMVGHAEILRKKLSEVKIRVEWKDAPSSLSTHYDGYGVSGLQNGSFTAAVSFRDGGTWEHAGDGVHLFESSDASSIRTFVFRAAGGTSGVTGFSEGMKIHALHMAGTRWARRAAAGAVLARPVLLPFRSRASEVRDGFITFRLERDFLHAAHRKKQIENVMRYSRGEKDSSGNPLPLTILNDPYTPAVQSISLDYTAHSEEVAVSSGSLDDFASSDLQFFHSAAFGQMREHGYQRLQFGLGTDVPLLPPFDSEGELLIGFRDLSPGDSVSLLFQAAEGSADPELPSPTVRWSVLCDNYWKPLGPGEVVLDTTRHLLASGVITFIVPAEATTRNTLLPPGLLWLKGGVARDVGAVCRLTEIAAGSVEVQFFDQGNDRGHLLKALPSASITRLKNAPQPIKGVRQPYHSFGGRPAEADSAFHARVAERLRHKNRCITAWDYERIILEAFPRVHRVKCIPHAREGCWLAPGHVLIVVVPDLKNGNAFDPLRPKVDAATLGRIAEHVRRRIAGQAEVQVKNPAYQPVRLDFKVRFRAGFEPNLHRIELDRAIMRFLSPWAFDAERDIAFGGKVYKSVLLDFVEELPYIDHVTDFRMFSASAGGETLDLSEVRAEFPDTILVSAAAHRIESL